MSVRQSFDDFLSSPGPSHTRGGGRGGTGTPRGSPFRGSRGRGRGGTPEQAGRGGHQGNARSFSADYSNVPPDYDRINNRGYSKLEGFAVTPFGPGQGDRRDGTPSGANTPRGRGAYRGSGGRGRGFGWKEQRTPSGAQTPVTGLGSRGKGKERETATVPGSRSTVGRGIGNGEVRWGGGAAPMFVKAGELFKDGQVDLVIQDKQGDIHVEVSSMADAAVPQMTDPRHEVEVDIRDQEQQTSAAPSPRGDVSALLGIEDVRSDGLHDPIKEAEQRMTRFMAAGTGLRSPSPVAQRRPSLVSHRSTNSSAQSGRHEETSNFFIDVEPAMNGSRAEASYRTLTSAPLGIPPDSPEEQIVFLPRSYREPEPIMIDPSNSITTSTALAISEDMITPQLPDTVFIDPRARPRKSKKAARKEKRLRNKKGKGGKRRGAAVDSDLEWGSDGPPPRVQEIEGAETDEEINDVEVLRDYLAGTLLNARVEKDGNAEGAEESDGAEVGSVGDGAAEMGGDEDIRELNTDEEGNGWTTDDGSTESPSVAAEGDPDSDASSELGDLTTLQAAVEDDDEDSDKEDELFKGNDSYDDMDWFVRNMEEALGGAPTSFGDKKGKKKLFKTIEEGDFGEDWPAAPVVKNKKNKHLPPELQLQWEKDRQTKARRKQQRELDRLAAEMAVNTIFGKGKGKRKSNTHPAALAHLIPASAAEVADMFDVSSDDGVDPRSRMNLMRNLLLPKTFDVIDVEIREFLDDAGRTTYSLPPMEREGRKKIHLLAECYGLKSKSRGSGKDRFTVLIKTSRSGLNIDATQIHRIVTAANASGGAFYKSLYARSSREKGRDKKKKKAGTGGAAARDTANGTSARHRDGELVGEGAERIGEGNVGHRLLSKMGWVEGGTIGAGKGGVGLDNPIVAVVKTTKMGLGA